MLERDEVIYSNSDYEEFKPISHPPVSHLEHLDRIESLDNRQSTSEAYLQVINSGMQTGEDIFLFNGPDNKPRTGNIVYSEMYNLKSTGTGEVIGYFFQYEEGYRGGDGYGIPHPGSVPDRKIARNSEGYIYQDNSERKVGYRGNETIRVLTVRYNPKSHEVEREYIKGKDLRYALEDKRKLDETRRNLKKLKETRNSLHENPKEDGKILELSTEVKIIAD